MSHNIIFYIMAN